MEEIRPERMKRASARRRTRESYDAPGQEIAWEKANRKFFYIAAGSILVALVAFLCGIQMGRSLSELNRTGDTGAALTDRRGKAPPFRVMEKGKGNQPEASERSREPVEKSKERDAGPHSGGGARPVPESVSAAPPEKSPPPQEEKPAAPKAKYSLQVAALNNSAEAEELVSDLKKKGYEAYQVTGTAAAKGTLHRVRIGHFQTLQEARQFALSFEKRENRKPIISTVQNP